jgi:hypothetical protein
VPAFLLRRYKKNAKSATIITAAATPIPIPAAAPLESPEGVLAPGVDVMLGEDVGADTEDVVDAEIGEDVEDDRDEEDEEVEEVMVATTL